MIWRKLLIPFTGAYHFLHLIDKHLKERRRYYSDLPVISVGNISTGGTGKTPVIIELIKRFNKYYPILVLSRGYGREKKDDVLWSVGEPIPDIALFGDEPTLIADFITNGGIAVSTNRTQCLKKIEQQFSEHLVLLDDGFQHYQLVRTIDIVIVDDDTLEDRLLPAGNLRESLTSLDRATVILASSEKGITCLRQAVSSSIPIFKFKRSVIPTNSKNLASDQEDRRGIAVCGIGKPDQFLSSLRRDNVDIISSKIYPDHHNYSRTDALEIQRLFEITGSEFIFTTRKDAVKLVQFENLRNYLLTVDLQITVDEKFYSLISEKLNNRSL